MSIKVQAGEITAIFAPNPNGAGHKIVTRVKTAAGQIWPPTGRSKTQEFVEPPPLVPGFETSPSLVVGPWWATQADVVMCSSGGGGAGGDGSFGRDGNGGRAGQWAHGTINTFPGNLFGIKGASVIAVVLAATGGVGGAKERSGARGPATTVEGFTSLSASGGEGGSGYGNATGASPGNYTAFGHTFTGGTGGTRGNPGTAPGGGGGGGRGGAFGNADGGAAGGGGYIWVRWRSD